MDENDRFVVPFPWMKTTLVALAAMTLIASLHAETANTGDRANTLVPQLPGALNRFERDGFEPREILLALQSAYPDRVQHIGRRDGDWAILADGTWFYWAAGRLLPEAERADASAYDPLVFYHYEPGATVFREYTNAERDELQARAAEMDRDPPRRHPGFLDKLWRVDNQNSRWERQKTTFFLGLKTMVHRDLLEDLAAVEEEILERARRDFEVAVFVESLRSIEGYNYRLVDGTATLSRHAYGVAVDLIPASYEGKQVYWRWARDGRVDWTGLAEDQRFSFPVAVVEAFERHGFVWGGKWGLFDAIHFEYRPEILLLNGYDPERR